MRRNNGCIRLALVHHREPRWNVPGEGTLAQIDLRKENYRRESQEEKICLTSTFKVKGSTHTKAKSHRLTLQGPTSGGTEAEECVCVCV